MRNYYKSKLGDRQLMWPTDWTRDDDALTALLSRWRGADAQTIEYSVSHGQLLVRLFHREAKVFFSAYVLCKGCDDVRFRSHWTNAALEFSATSGETPKGYLLTDSDRLSVSCSSIFAAEARELVFLEHPGRVA